MIEEKLGKIKDVYFGLGGYQGCQIVFYFKLGGENWDVTSLLDCGWGHTSEEDIKKHPDWYCWDHDTRINQIGKRGWEVIQIMKDAKVSKLSDLIGKPVRVYQKGFQLDRWEILKEVL